MVKFIIKRRSPRPHVAYRIMCKCKNVFCIAEWRTSVAVEHRMVCNRCQGNIVIITKHGRAEYRYNCTVIESVGELITALIYPNTGVEYDEIE